MIAIWHIIPALKVGNSVVIKPSSLTPMNTIRLAELINEHTIPNLVQTVIGEKEVGEPLVRHPEVKKLIFTGSTAVGKHLASLVAGDLKKATLELGGNDGLRGIALTETKKNLLAIVDKVRAKYPNTKIILAGMQIPPNMGQEYTEEFKAIYPAVAKEKNIELIPFLLEGVAGDPDLNLPDGIHPTAEGHRLVMETLWPYISKAL